MTVTLPETMRDELRLKAKSAGFRDVDTYVAYLVVADDGDGVDEFADAEFAIPDEFKNDIVTERRMKLLANSM
jgi:NADPH-dependent 7-cyano-7-deazaguanine reductase QueF-like protein